MNTGTILPVPKRVPRKQSYLTLPYPTLPYPGREKRSRQLSRTPSIRATYLTCSPAKMFTVRAKEQLEERIPVQVGTTAPGECSCAGQVGRLALYPFALFWPTKYRGEGRGESEEKGRGNGQRGERESSKVRTCVRASFLEDTRTRRKTR